MKTETTNTKSNMPSAIRKGISTPTGFLEYGEHEGKVDLVTVVPTGDQPAIYVRITTANNAQVTHITRFANETSRRIGIGEIRAAFPDQLLGCSDKEVVVKLLRDTSSFVGLPVKFSVYPQIDKKTKLAVLDKNGGEYFNVRLTSAIRDIKDEEKARSLADAMFTVEGTDHNLPAGWQAPE